MKYIPTWPWLEGVTPRQLFCGIKIPTGELWVRVTLGAYQDIATEIVAYTLERSIEQYVQLPSINLLGLDPVTLKDAQFMVMEYLLSIDPDPIGLQESAIDKSFLKGEIIKISPETYGQ